MITNDAGEVAIAYYQPAPVHVSASKTPSKTAYVFVVQRAVSLAWVDAQDADALLAMRGGCCGRRRQLFAHASDGQVSLWTDGTRGPGGGGNTPCGC